MSQSEDEDYAFFGTPLEQFEEDLVPRKKPMTVQDQIAIDKQGRRRFHGAFTGGFSAGFYNTVGSLEGWTPSSFKSSREKKADSKYQKPEDFMDEEDFEEFGIAPTVVRAKPEYSGSKAQKRERIRFSDGPIPGEPVLKSILEPVRETIGVLLLMKMGWKPGQGIGPRLTQLQRKREKAKNKVKIYGCSLSEQAYSPDDDDDGDDIDESIYNPTLLFAPAEHEIHFLHPKTNTLGMGYSGLDKKCVLSNNSTFKSDTFRMFDNNKKLAIKGQAFGVGAFEEEDDDIYSREDISQYDFALETTASLRDKRRKEKEANKMLAITDGSSKFLEGFVPASKSMPAKKLFPPPQLPPEYEPVHPKRKTRFDNLGSNINDNNMFKNKHIVTAKDRAAILEDIRPKNFTDESKPAEDDFKQINTDSFEGFRPFVADPEKQERYEKYLHFLRIGAKSAFPSIQPKSMSDWEREREINEFDQAARLYKPLSGYMAERFAHGELPDDSTDPLSVVPKSFTGEDADIVEAAKSKMFGKLTRKINDWSPCAILCKRMNIAGPLDGDGVSLSQVANNKKTNRSKFSVFNFLDVNYKNSLECTENSTEEDSETKKESSNAQEIVDPSIKVILKTSLTLPDPIDNFEEPLEKKDLFKAIFCSDEEESDEEEDQIGKNEKAPQLVSNITPNTKPPISVANALRNTSPPRGIFANLDLDAINKRKTPTQSHESSTQMETSLSTASTKLSSDDSNKVDEANIYGPSLPTKHIFTVKKEEVHRKSPTDSSSDEEEWVEKNDKKEKKKHRKHKKSKKKHKKKSKNKEK